MLLKKYQYQKTTLKTCLTTVIVFGANGMLGRYLVQYLKQFPIYNVIAIERNHIDVVHDKLYQKLYNLLDKETNIARLKCPYYLNHNNFCQCDFYVINCIGLIPQSVIGSDDNSENYFKINTVFPHVLAGICSQFSIKYIHPSTDCVFSGKKGNYIESDRPDEHLTYGLSKRLGEPENACVIRTSIIGEEIHHKNSLLEFVKKPHQHINGYEDHKWNGVTCLQLAKIINDIIRKKLYWTGIRHIFSPLPVSKYELVLLINEIWNLNKTIKKTHPGFCDKTLSSIHSCIFTIPDIKTQLIELKHFDITKK